MPQNDETKFKLLTNGDLLVYFPLYSIKCLDGKIVKTTTDIQITISAEQLSQLAIQSKEKYDQYQFDRSNL